MISVQNTSLKSRVSELEQELAGSRRDFEARTSAAREEHTKKVAVSGFWGEPDMIGVVGKSNRRSRTNLLSARIGAGGTGQASGGRAAISASPAVRGFDRAGLAPEQERADGVRAFTVSRRFPSIFLGMDSPGPSLPNMTPLPWPLDTHAALRTGCPRRTPP